MFRTVSILGFVVVFGFIILHWLISGPKSDEVFGEDRDKKYLDGLRWFVFLITMLFSDQRENITGAFRKIVHFVGMFTFAVLLVTGFVPKIFFGELISGYVLMLHATAAPVFAICIALLAVIWADKCVFNLRQQKLTSKIIKFEIAQKALFWVILPVAFVMIVSMAVSMFNIFGTDGQHFLMQTHRYSALVFALAVLLHMYTLIFLTAQRNHA